MKVNKRIFLFLSVIAVSVVCFPQQVIQNVISREKTSLNGKWKYIVDPYETGYYNYRQQPRDEENYFDPDAIFNNAKATDKTQKVEYDFDLSPTMNIPGDWNSQDDKLFYYEGTVWFKKSFDYAKSEPGNRVYVNFGAVNYRADVYLNGKKLGFHEGGFTPFGFEITKILKPKDNFLIVKVDNKRRRDAVPTVNADWWNYGGITRDVDIIETPASFVIDYLIQLKKDSGNVISGYIRLDGISVSGKTVTLSIPEMGFSRNLVTDEKGYAGFEFVINKITYWSPENPKLYNLVIKNDKETINDRIGFRMISVKGHDILLNGQPVFLKGISIHEENPLRGGRAYCIEDARMLLTWAKELGCNFVRLAHYPHNEYMLRLADEMGIMVWEENPVYWSIMFENETTYNLAEKQLSEMMSRDKNRSSVIIWSMANETPLSNARIKFINKLISYTRLTDNTRIVSAAMEISGVEGKEGVLTVNDPLVESVDIISFNEYIGWYSGLPDACKETTWEIKQDKPVIISEFGGDALYGMHGDTLTRWSEEYQENLYKKNLDMLGKIPQLRGMSPWILADFRSPRRLLPGIQDGWNRKGLISEKGYKKKAFYILQKYYKTK
jgi:beta-glucuronidase